MADDTNPRAVEGDNKPPLIEVARSDIREQLLPLNPRLQELLASVGRAVCDSPETAGKCADLVKQLKKLGTRADNIRKDVKEPYLEASNAVQAAGNGFLDQIKAASQTVIKKIEDYEREQRAKRQKEEAEARQREQEERNRADSLRRQEEERARAAGIAAAPPPPPPPPPEPPKPAKRAPIATGDYGAMASTVKRMVPTVVDVYALPETVLNSPKVTEAILTVVRGLRTANSDLEIPGIEYVEDHSVRIR